MKSRGDVSVLGNEDTGGPWDIDGVRLKPLDTWCIFKRGVHGRPETEVQQPQKSRREFLWKARWKRRVEKELPLRSGHDISVKDRRRRDC